MKVQLLACRLPIQSLLPLIFCAALTCTHAQPARQPVEVAPGVLQIGRIDAPQLRESSGIIASRNFTNVFWTHNDRGNRPVLYGIRRSGELLAEFEVTGAVIHDWEDIAADENENLFIADIGNNDSKRTELAVHQIAEPDPAAKRGKVAISRSWKLRFPGRPFDCESLFIWQTNAYVISKVVNDARASIYRFPLASSEKPLVLELVAETKIQSPVTGADISRDGSLLGIVTKSGAFLYHIEGDVGSAGQKNPRRVKFKRYQIEACTLVADGLLATAESREILLFPNAAFGATRD